MKLYNLDKMQKISLNRVFIGNSYIVTEIIQREWKDDSSVLTSFNSKMLEANILLYSTDDYLKYSDFIDIESNNHYKCLFYPSRGDVYISLKTLKAASIELGICGPVVVKQKLLEKYREYKKINV